MSVPADETLALENFVPYRLSIVANRVSGGLSRLYAERFNLSIPQWRVLAVLARGKGVTAEQVCRATAMDKVAVSRAVARLVARRFVIRRRDAADGRRRLLSLSASGRRVYEQIVPLARAYERDLLERVDGARAELGRVLDALEAATAGSDTG